jgi:streptomycin 6-kinase
LRDPEPLPLAALVRRLDIFCEALGLDRARPRDWCFAEAVLNARWCQLEDPEWLSDRLAWAERMLQL